MQKSKSRLGGEKSGPFWLVRYALKRTEGSAHGGSSVMNLTSIARDRTCVLDVRFVSAEPQRELQNILLNMNEIGQGVQSKENEGISEEQESWHEPVRKG